mmetsp:Transcript_45923/g.142119  ORF Transcript_45923/g.142119 Transcript_45923/m.142119 type:complete len:347 (-) Transcript_45923:84-1124(-)
MAMFCRPPLLLLAGAALLAAASPEQGSCSAPGSALAARQQGRGLALLQSRAAFGAPLLGHSTLKLTLEVDVALDPYAGTETGASVAFLVKGKWTKEYAICMHTNPGETVVKQLELPAWPTSLRVTALGDDALSYSKIELSFGRFVVTVLDVFTGNSTYGNGSAHWVDANEEAPRQNVYPVSAIPLKGAKEALKPKTPVPAANANESQAGPNCTTRFDPRASAVGYDTALPGTPCIFGLDPRDEGAHCVLDDGSYGSFGWCYTSADKGSFGSCSENCPLFGPLKTLGKKIEELRSALESRPTVPPVPPTTTTRLDLNPANAANHSGTWNNFSWTNSSQANSTRFTHR